MRYAVKMDVVQGYNRLNKYHYQTLCNEAGAFDDWDKLEAEM